MTLIQWIKFKIFAILWVLDEQGINPKALILVLTFLISLGLAFLAGRYSIQ